MAVNIKELVDKINDSPTMLVKVKIGGRDAHDTVIAKPAYYEDERDAARVYYYYGPLDPDNWVNIRYANSNEEKVVEGTILKQSVISAFSTYETELDALPLRDLPLWAKELWVKDRERYRPGHAKDAVTDYMKVEAMKMLIDEEREQGGLNPNDMSAEMQGRYLKLQYSTEVIERMRGRGVKEGDLKTLFENIRLLEEVVPNIRELPWRTQKGLDPESMFNREDVYELLLYILHDAMYSLEMLVQHLILVREADEKEKQDG